MHRMGNFCAHLKHTRFTWVHVLCGFLRVSCRRRSAVKRWWLVNRTIGLLCDSVDVFLSVSCFSFSWAHTFQGMKRFEAEEANRGTTPTCRWTHMHTASCSNTTIVHTYSPVPQHRIHGGSGHAPRPPVCAWPANMDSAESEVENEEEEPCRSTGRGGGASAD